MFQVLALKSNRTGMKWDLLSKETSETINLLEIREFKDQSLLKTIQLVTECSLSAWTVMMMKTKINNKCKCQYLIQDKSWLCIKWNQSSISTKMWAKKGTFSSITILRAIRCWEIELDQFRSRDQTCQVDRAINSWIKMGTIKDMTEIKWICKDRVKLITKT